MPRKKTPPANPIDAIKHADRRANIPTEELRDFVPDDERSAEAKLYRRDPSLDPQLVWQGKDEQDAEDLAVPVVPIYILRDRLLAARELLTETGSVFVQIGDENVHLVRCLMDEVFGRKSMFQGAAIIGRQMCKGYKTLQKSVVLNS